MEENPTGGNAFEGYEEQAATLTGGRGTPRETSETLTLLPCISAGMPFKVSLGSDIGQQQARMHQP